MARRKKAKSPRELDPHRQREAKKYSNPIPSREFILETLSEAGVPLNFEEIAAALDISDEQDVVALQRRLGAMVRDGQLVRNRRDAYCLVNKRDLIAGRVIGHQDGFGFVKPDEGGDDVYLYPREMRALFHNDRVVVRVTGRDRRGRLEGSVVEVLERNTRTVVGRFYQESGVGFVVPDNKRLAHDIIIPRDRIEGSEQGQIVVAEITDQPTKRTQPIGKVVEVVGDHMASGMETDIAIRTHDLPVEWPDEVEAEIAGLDTQVPEAAKEGRTDLREHPAGDHRRCRRPGFRRRGPLRAQAQGLEAPGMHRRCLQLCGARHRPGLPKATIAATRSIFRIGSCPCCRRFCPTASAPSTRMWTGCAWPASST